MSDDYMLYDLADSFFADVKALHVKRYMVVGDFYLVIEDFFCLGRVRQIFMQHLKSTREAKHTCDT
jgi:hypothetical protein